MKTIIKNGKVVFFDRVEDVDILIEDGKIKSLSKQVFESADKIIDAKDKLVMSSFVDLETHIESISNVRKDNLVNVLHSAVKGGYSLINIMPDSDAVIDNLYTMKHVLESAKNCNLAEIKLCVAATKDLHGTALTELAVLKNQNSVTLTNCNNNIDSSLTYKLMRYVNQYGYIFLSLYSDIEFIEKNKFKSTPFLAQELGIMRDMLLAESLQAPICFTNIASWKAVELIKDAKNRIVKNNIMCATSPFYFCFNNISNLNENVFPPLNTERDNVAIINGIMDDTIEIITSKHTALSKQNNISGVSGIEYTFAAAFTFLVKSGKIDISKLSRLMTQAPSKLLNINNNGIAVGENANFAIVDINKKTSFENTLAKGKNMPYNKLELYGEISKTIINGEIKYNAEKSI